MIYWPHMDEPFVHTNRCPYCVYNCNGICNNVNAKQYYRGWCRTAGVCHEFSIRDYSAPSVIAWSIEKIAANHKLLGIPYPSQLSIF